MSDSKKDSNPYSYEWKKTLQDKTKEELLVILQHEGEYDPEFIQMVRKRLEKDFGLVAVNNIPLQEVQPKVKIDNWETIKGLSGIFEQVMSTIVFIVVSFLLGMFAFLCVCQAIDNFSSWHILDGMWYLFFALFSGSILFFMIMWKVKRIRESKLETKNQGEISFDTNMKGAHDLLNETLEQMGCQPEIGVGGQMEFMFQGDYFTADADNDSPYAVVWYTFWKECELNDIERLSKLKHTINDINTRFNINVIYSIDNVKNMLYVHSKVYFLLISQIPDRQGYLQSILSGMFQVKRVFEKELANHASV